jgi:hypothetical protein
MVDLPRLFSESAFEKIRLLNELEDCVSGGRAIAS